MNKSRTEALKTLFDQQLDGGGGVVSKRTD